MRLSGAPGLLAHIASCLGQHCHGGLFAVSRPLHWDSALLTNAFQVFFGSIPCCTTT